MALGALFWVVPQVFPLYSHWPMWASVFEYLGFINLALAIFNLLPGLPLDGGRIFRALLWARWNDFVRATARAADWGRGIAYGLIALGALEIYFGSLMGGLWLIFVALFEECRRCQPSESGGRTGATAHTGKTDHGGNAHDDRGRPHHRASRGRILLTL